MGKKGDEPDEREVDKYLKEGKAIYKDLQASGDELADLVKQAADLEDSAES